MGCATNQPCRQDTFDSHPNSSEIGRSTTDSSTSHAYPNNIRRNWYEHVHQVVLPVLEADQDWQNTIKTREATAEYMIDKRDAGRSMLDAQETFLAR